jgi:hypothetical protein
MQGKIKCLNKTRVMGMMTTTMMMMIDVPLTLCTQESMLSSNFMANNCENACHDTQAK